MEKQQGTMYVIVDALGGSWIVPKVFFKYLEVVDEGIMPKVDVMFLD